MTTRLGVLLALVGLLALATRTIAVRKEPTSTLVSAFAAQYLLNPRVGASQFGMAIDLAASTLVVGEAGQPLAGRVYVYSLSAASPPAWTQHQIITSPANSTQYLDRFGFSVALSADATVLVIGAPRNGTGTDSASTLRGNAWVWSRADESAQFVQTAFLSHPTPRDRDKFGTQVAISDDASLIFVRSVFLSACVAGEALCLPPTTFNNAGVHVFRRTAGSWPYLSSIKTNETFRMSNIGQPFSINAAGSKVWIASNDLTYTYGFMANQTTRTRIVRYALNTTNDQWMAETVYRAPSQQMAQQIFGFKVLVAADDEVYISAPRNDSTVFRFDASTPPAVTNSLKMGNEALYIVQDLANCGQLLTPWRTDSNFFGGGMAMSPNKLLLAVGAPYGFDALLGRGTVYLFARYTPTGAWFLAETFMSSTEFSYESTTDAFVRVGIVDEFGLDVALTDTAMVVASKGISTVVTFDQMAQYYTVQPPPPAVVAPPPPPPQLDEAPAPPPKSRSIVLPLVLGLLGILIFLILLFIGLRFAFRRYLRSRLLKNAAKKKAPTETGAVALTDSPPAAAE